MITLVYKLLLHYRFDEWLGEMRSSIQISNILKTKYILIILITVFNFAYPIKALADSISVIVNAKNPVTNISLSEIREFFLKERTKWPSGEACIPLDLKISLIHRDIFLKKVINKTVGEFEEYWLNRKQTSGDYPPLKITSDYLMIKTVAKMKSAIGYIKSSSANGSTSEGVKVVAVVGE